MPPSGDEGLEAGADRVEVCPDKPERESDRGKGYQSINCAVHCFTVPPCPCHLMKPNRLASVYRSVIADFKGHHFVEDWQPNEPPLRHHCERCGIKAVLQPDGSTDFVDGSGAPVRIGAGVALSTSAVPGCWQGSG